MSRLKETYHKILDYGTELLGLDLKYFASGGFWTFLGQGFNTVLSFILLIAFANLLPKETYGLYNYILSLVSILSIFSLTGMNTAVSQAAATGNDGALKTSLKYQLKWNLMMAIALLGLGGYYFWSHNNTLAISLFILGILSPATLALETYSPFLHGKKDFKHNNIFSGLANAIYVAGMLLAVYLSKDIVILVAIYALTTFAANLFFYIKTTKLFPAAETPSRDVLAYGRKITYIKFMSPIVAQIDKIVLANFWGVEQLAVYTLASVIPERIGPYIKDLIDLGMPKLMVKTPEEINKVFWKRILQAIGIGAILTLGYIFFAPFVFKYFLPKYLESVFYSQILAITFIFIAPIGYAGAAITSQKLVGKIFASSFTMSTVKILLYIIFGIWGGILGLILAQVVYYFIAFWVNIGLWKFKPSKLLT